MGVSNVWGSSMKSFLLLCFLLLLDEGDAAKGGAKSVMNRRKNRNRQGGSYYRHRKPDDDEEGSGEDLGPLEGEPFIGLCLIMKERGITFPPPPRDPPCIGICQHRRQLGIVVDERKEAARRRRRPCIGLCYRRKLENMKMRQRG